MPSQKVKMILRAFRAHFETKQQDIPMALRQESPDIVFSALLEDDEPMGAGPMPPLNLDANMGVSPQALGGEDPQETVRQLLGAAGMAPEAAMGMPPGAEMGMDPMAMAGGAPGPSGAAPGASVDRGSELAAMLGMT